MTSPSWIFLPKHFSAPRIQPPSRRLWFILCYDSCVNTSALYLRTIIFGVNDSLVSTVGLLAGISVAGVPRSTLALTGIVYAFVEGFSMASGEFVSEESAEEYMKVATATSRSSIISALLMFFSFVLASLVPLTPYLVLPRGVALVASVLVSVLALFVVGTVSARFAHLPVLWRGLIPRSHRVNLDRISRPFRNPP